MKLLDSLITIIWISLATILLILLFLWRPHIFNLGRSFSLPNPPNTEIFTPIKDPIPVAQDQLLVKAPGIELIKKHCLACHNAQLILQNKMSEERWTYAIKWMQRTQGLWDLGEDERPIIEYLATYYAPTLIGRRSNLIINQGDWYELKEFISQ